VSGPDEQKIGTRVTMLIRSTDGSHRELLGRLLTTNSVLRKDGTEVTFDPTQVISWRVVSEQPLRKPTSQRIREIEQAGSATWPAVEVVRIGGWELRASSGYSHRANSAQPIGAPPFGEPSGDFVSALQEVVDFYRSRNLTPLFQIPLPSYSGLDAALEIEGWQPEPSVSVQVCDLSPLANPSQDIVEITSRPDDKWLVLHQRSLGRDGLAVLTGANAFFATIRKVDPITGEEVVAAIGRAAISQSWCGISAIRTAEQFQRQGLAESIVSALAQHAIGKEAVRAFLQVSADNMPALALYQKLGFTEHHTYKYRSLT